MKCPNCKYIHGLNFSTIEAERGNKGDFYSLPIELKREKDWDTDEKSLYGCPNCGITFIDV